MRRRVYWELQTTAYARHAGIFNPAWSRTHAGTSANVAASAPFTGRNGFFLPSRVMQFDSIFGFFNPARRTAYFYDGTARKNNPEAEPALLFVAEGVNDRETFEYLLSETQKAPEVFPVKAAMWQAWRRAFVERLENAPERRGELVNAAVELSIERGEA